MMNTRLFGALILLFGAHCTAVGQTSQDNPQTTLTLHVPAEARVYMLGQLQDLTGKVRHFTTRRLAPGAQVDYSVQVEVEREGQVVRQEQTFVIVGGRRHRLRFDFPPPGQVMTSVTIHVPADAEVYLAGRRTYQQGTVRAFNTRLLASGRTLPHYPIQAVVWRNGQRHRMAQWLDIVAGRNHEIIFNFPGSQPPIPPVERLTTQDLEQYLWERVSGNTPFDWEVDNFAAGHRWGFTKQAGESWQDAVRRDGGLFGLSAEVEGAPAPYRVYDNVSTYLWSHEGQKERRLPLPHKPDQSHFVHIIPMRSGLHQPDMLKFMQEGDICVYFHPETGRGAASYWEKLLALTDWRCTHASIVIEQDVGGRTILSKVDTPPEFAKPFTGAVDVPFHVFRFMPRDDRGNALLEADEYRRQAARWATLMFKKNTFERNYDNMTLRTPQQIVDYAKYFLDPNTGESGDRRMYCSWLAFCGWSLAYMTPINEAGLPDGDLFGGLAFNKLASPLHILSNSHKYGRGTKDEYRASPSLPQDLTQFPFPIATAPELVLNVFDRTLGPDEQYLTLVNSLGVDARPDDLARVTSAWKLHAQTKQVVLDRLEKGKQLDRFRLTSPPHTPEEVQKYNTMMNEALTQAKTLYDELAKSPYGSTQALQAGIKKAIGFSKGVIDRARADASLGKKWLPPYGFFREAEAFERFYELPPTSHPKAVYVGTVIHERYLKPTGSRDRTRLDVLDPVPDTADEQNRALDSIATVLGGSRDGAIDRLFDELNKLDNEKTGFNGPESRALTLMKEYWNPNATDMQDINNHNNYGLDPVLYRRLLIAYWNDPMSLRHALYEDPGVVSLGSAATNARILFADRQPQFETLKPVAQHNMNNADDPNPPHPRLMSELLPGIGSGP